MKVLIVDDDELVRETIVEIVRYAGHEAIAISDRDHAMSEISQHQLGAALIDLHLVAGSFQCDGLVVAGACVDAGVERVFIITGSEPSPQVMRQIEQLDISLLKKPLGLAVVMECLR